ncbi:MAG: OmpP1/FadL family transporter [Elusimicrobiales bacterium]
MVNIIVLVVAVLMGLAGSVNAAGFRLSEQDARANGMGNTAVAVADNPAAVWYNPAAITGFEGTNLSLGSVMVLPQMEHTNTNGSKDRIKQTVHIPPHFFATRKLNEKFSLGLGVLAPFGLSTEWDKLTANTRKVATDSEIQAVNYNLNGAYKFNQNLSVAAGVDYYMVDATLNKWHPNPIVNNEIKLEGDGNGTGYNVAAQYKWNKYKFGANYHSKVKVKLEGDIAATGVYTGDVKTEITLPDMLQVGVAHQCTDSWLFTAEADYTNWSTYRKITIRKISDSTVVGTPDTKNWSSVWAFRLGGEHKVNENWKLRVGAFYDVNPVKEDYFETRVPDSDRVAVSFGAGWNKGNITVDASYLYLRFMKRTIDDSIQDNATGTPTAINGKYASVARLPAITIGYKF